MQRIRNQDVTAASLRAFAVRRENACCNHIHGDINMKRSLGLFIISFFLAAAPMVFAQSDYSGDHFEVGAFADYYRLADPSPTRNFIGLGGRGAFGITSNVEIEAEMAYDFQRNYTYTCSNCVSTSFVTSGLRTLHGFFGPKFQTGSGLFRFFVTTKVGFDNFSQSNQSALNGFTSSVALTGSGTYLAVYPGGGIEAFAGPIGIRAEAGDDVFFNNGAHNNLRVTFGPQFRF
jgi:hypothetical protein